MRILKREAEGGITIIDWHGGFLGVTKNGHDWRHFRAWFDNCPCCKGAFDLGIEAFGFELMAYNDGGPCELEEYYEDFEHDLTAVEVVR